MPVTPDSMTVDAKLEHWSSDIMDRTATQANAPVSGLYDPDRMIVIVKAYLEVMIAHLVASGVYTLGKASPSTTCWALY